jgi:hypothetical protein
VVEGVSCGIIRAFRVLRHVKSTAHGFRSDDKIRARTARSVQEALN